MKRLAYATVACTLVAGVAHASDNPAITGSGSLRPIVHAAVASADGRFQLDSNFRPAPATVQTTGACSVTAKLATASPNTTCAPASDIIFQHGFD